LNKINPVDFHGKEMKVSHVVRSEDKDDDEEEDSVEVNSLKSTDSVNSAPAVSAPPKYSEKELSEGEEITISQNNF